MFDLFVQVYVLTTSYGLGVLVCGLVFQYLEHNGDKPTSWLAVFWPLTFIPILVLWLLCKLTVTRSKR